MTSQVLAQAEWAVKTKLPATRDDYKVLASSTGLLSRGEFDQVIKTFTAGDPSFEPDVANALPWVTLSRLGVSGELYLGISVEVPTPDKDGTGRPISRITYYCVPYARFWPQPAADGGNYGGQDLGGQARTPSPVSYQDLYLAVRDQAMPTEGDGPPVGLAIDPLDSTDMVRAVHEFGELNVAATAAALLGGPVTITGSGFPDTMGRLRFFDAVAALLPYGYRTHLTAATWSDNGAGGRFRIVFAARARDEASRAQWGKALRPPAGGPAERYLGYLRRVVGRGDDEQLRLLIEHLASDGEPRKFEEPQHAIDSLHGFFLAETVSERADAGDVPIEDLRKVFATGQVRQLPQPKREQLYKRLIALAGPLDSGLVTSWFSEIAADRPDEFVAALADASRTRLWSVGLADLSREYLRFLWQRSLADDLLARIVSVPDPGAQRMEGLDRIGELLKDSVIAQSGGTGLYPRTQRALAANPAAGAALLAGLAASTSTGNQSLNNAADWLEPVADRVVQPFVSLLGDAFGSGAAAEPVSADALRALNRDGGPAAVQYLLRAASYRDRLRLVLPGLACWLAAAYLQQGVPEAADRYWDGVTRELSTRDAGEAAWLDLVLLATGNSPRALLAGNYAQPQYSQRLAAAWRQLADTVRQQSGGRADEMLEAALIAALRREPWRGDAARTAAVRSLIESLSAAAPRPALMALVLDARESLQQLAPGSDPGQIGQVCARAYVDGLAVERVADMLRASGAVTNGPLAVQVIDEMHLALRAAKAGNASFHWPLQFAGWFANGTFGPRIAAEFPQLGARRIAEQLDFRVRLLDMVLRATPAEAPPAIGAELADNLDDDRQVLEKVVKDARKRHSRDGGLVGRMFGKGGEGPGEQNAPDGTTAKPKPPPGEGGPRT